FSLTAPLPPRTTPLSLHDALPILLPRGAICAGKPFERVFLRSREGGLSETHENSRVRAGVFRHIPARRTSPQVGRREAADQPRAGPPSARAAPSRRRRSALSSRGAAPARFATRNRRPRTRTAADGRATQAPRQAHTAAPVTGPEPSRGRTTCGGALRAI